jgi:uncharacterized FlaG/YvyC family protein
MDVQQVASPASNAAVATSAGQTDSDPSASTVGTAAAAAPQPAASASDSQSLAKAQPGGIAPVVAKIFGEGIPQPVTLNVSYRVDGAEIVTVFSDPKSGKEIAQFPSELMIKLAEFFDKSHGATLDKSA